FFQHIFDVASFFISLLPNSKPFQVSERRKEKLESRSVKYFVDHLQPRRNRRGFLFCRTRLPNVLIDSNVYSCSSGFLLATGSSSGRAGSSSDSAGAIY